MVAAVLGIIVVLSWCGVISEATSGEQHRSRVTTTLIMMFSSITLGVYVAVDYFV